MGSLEIVAAETRRALRAFIDLPYRLHRNHPQFVPPLRRERHELFDRSRHPFFRHAEAVLFLARRNGRLVGRIEAIVNHAHNRFHEDRVGFFGAFESENDRAVSEALLEGAAGWLKRRGMEVMRGPVTHSTNEECGLLIDGFQEPPMVGMPYNPPYYAALLEAFGLTKAKDLYAWEVRADREIPDKIPRVAEIARRSTNVVVRQVSFADYAGEIRRAVGVYNASWTRKPGPAPRIPAGGDRLDPRGQPGDESSNQHGRAALQDLPPVRPAAALRLPLDIVPSLPLTRAYASAGRASSLAGPLPSSTRTPNGILSRSRGPGHRQFAGAGAGHRPQAQ